MLTIENNTDMTSAVIERVWSDSAFKERLKTDPRRALSEMGIQISSSVEIEVVENTESKIYFTIPDNPSVPHASDDDLEALASPIAQQSTHPCCPYTKKNVYVP